MRGLRPFKQNSTCLNILKQLKQGNSGRNLGRMARPKVAHGAAGAYFSPFPTKSTLLEHPETIQAGSFGEKHGKMARPSAARGAAGAPSPPSYKIKLCLNILKQLKQGHSGKTLVGQCVA